ncbi:MAG: class I SAM-dependent methyltransferase [Gammaproteobacteria bacterium]
MTDAPLAVVSDDGQFADASRELAASLALPLLDEAALAHLQPQFRLCFTNSGLALQQTPFLDAGLLIDFSNADLLRRAQESYKKQGLGKAVGIKPGYRPTILDATAGLGKDSFLLASQGCQVTLLERSPVIHALLTDAFARAAGLEQLAAVMARLQLLAGDFRYSQTKDSSYDVVYLDPMFPVTGKTARVKKSMQLLQGFLQQAEESLTEAQRQDEERQLLQTARSMARKRIVVKRAKLSHDLAGAAPDISFRGKSNRFDVYLQAAK